MVSLTGAVVFNRVAKYIQIYQLKIKFIIINLKQKLLNIA